jgi:aryl-alcohol dehydrogenase-like predicted oxidoreductase
LAKSRRNFIRNGFIGLAGAIFAPTVLKKGKKTTTSPEKERKFIYRTLGKTGIKLPVVSMGTCDETGFVNAALDAGIVHIDTSANYNEGNDERMFGEVFKSRPHDSYVIGTSIGMWQFRKAEQIKNKIRAQILRDYIEGSLKRLDLDSIDIYYLGGIQHKEIVLYEPYLEVLKEYKKAG